MLTPLPLSPPTPTTSLDTCAHWTEALFPLYPKTEVLFHAQHRVPPQPLDRPIKLGSIKSSVCHHNHCPILRYDPRETRQHFLPIGPPFSLLHCWNNLPSYWD